MMQFRPLHILSIMLITVLAATASADVVPEETAEEGQTFRVRLSGETTLVSFAPSQTGKYTVTASNADRVPAVFILLGPDYQQLTMNMQDQEMADGLTFRAKKGTTYHIAAAVVNTDDIGKTLNLKIRYEKKLADSEVKYFYGDVVK